MNTQIKSFLKKLILIASLAVGFQVSAPINTVASAAEPTAKKLTTSETGQTLKIYTSGYWHISVQGGKALNGYGNANLRIPNQKGMFITITSSKTAKLVNGKAVIYIRGSYPTNPYVKM